jgi:hypothetical protein
METLEGYGVRVYGGTEFWASGSATSRSERTVRLLKLHGSMNWQREADGIRLKQRPYTKQRGGLRFEIIPPAWNKPVAEDALYSRIWKQARIALAEATILVIAGYSLPPSDLLSQALLRISSEEGASKKLLLLANPNQDVRDRIRNTIKASLNERTTIVEVQRFDELAKVIRTS